MGEFADLAFEKDEAEGVLESGKIPLRKNSNKCVSFPGDREVIYRCDITSGHPQKYF